VTGAFAWAFSSAAAGGGETAEDRFWASGEYDRNKAMAWHWPSLPQGLVDFSAGMGDTVSFGLTQYIRERNGIDHVVDHSSSSYRGGQIAGIPAGAGTVFAGGVALNMGIRAIGGASTLYHFTSATAASGIAAEGAIIPSVTGSMGVAFMPL